MLRKIFFYSLVLLLIPVLAFSRAKFPSKEQVNTLFSTTTYVVADENQLSLDGFLRKAVEKSWNITDYQFISYQEFEALKDSAGKVFLLVNRASYEKDTIGIDYRFISVVISDTTGNLSQFPEFVSLPISYDGQRAMENAIYIVEPAIKFIQLHLKNVRDKRLAISIRKLKYYNKYAKSIKGSELILNTENLPDSLVRSSAFGKYYSGKYELLSSGEYSKSIVSANKSKLFVYMVKPYNNLVGRCFTYVINNETGQMYFYKSFKADVANECVITMKYIKRFNGKLVL